MARRKKPKGRLRNAVKKLVQKGAAAAKKGVGVVGTLPLLPYKPAIVSIVKRNGQTPEKQFTKLLKQFFNIIRSKKSNLDTDFESIDPVTITAIISTITAFFKELKEKKKRGEKLSEFENDVVEKTSKIADIVEDVSGEVNNAADYIGDQSKGARDAKPDNKKMLLIGAAALVAFLPFKK